MNKLTAVLLGGAAALTFNAAQAAPAAIVPAQSYADLLQPVPDAVAALQADDTARARQPKVELAQFRGHHHHHHGFYGGGPRFGFGYYGGPYYGGSYYGSSYYDYGYDPGPPVAYGAPAPEGGDVAYCMQHYRSYDPNSGTYLGLDHQRHPCP
jgi:hypothetical protein